MRHDFDIGVVGAGPAGARVAWRLARAGARVAMFDASHPREKPCGGGVTGRALARVAGMLDGITLDGLAVERARFDEPHGAPASIVLDAHGFSPQSSLVVLARREFDLALADAAERSGALLLRQRVTEVVPGPEGVDIVTRDGRYRVARVVGADGATSLVRRRCARPFARRQLSTARGFFARDTSSSEIAIGFVSDPAGYTWSFPRPDHLAIGICAQADETTPAALDAHLASWAARAGLASGCRREPYGWPIPSLSAEDFARERPAGPRWLLVGDAAGLVDPITREGIAFALESADLAAGALLGDSAGDTYVAALRRHIVPELARAARLKRGFFRGRFTRLLVDGLRSSAPVRGIMADLVAGRQPYATLKRRLIGTFEVRLAWQLLRLELGWHRDGKARASAVARGASAPRDDRRG